MANFTQESQNFTLLECSCSDGHLDCPEGAEGPKPPKVNVSFRNLLENTNVNKWDLYYVVTMLTVIVTVVNSFEKIITKDSLFHKYDVSRQLSPI